MNYKKRIKIINTIVIILCLIVALFPIYWMFNTSLKGSSEIYQRVPTLIPKEPSLDAYKYVYTRTPLLRGIFNSFTVALFVSVFSIAIAYPAAYAIAKLSFKGKRIVSRGVLFSYLIPASVLYIPLYIFLSSLGLNNSLWGLMLIYPTLTIPYATWMLIPYIMSIPKELEEASFIDGCSTIECMYRIVFPLALPGIVSTFIVAFSICWGEYLYALVNINSTNLKTFPVVIPGLIYGDIYPWDQIMASAITACIPVLLLYIITSSFVVGGKTAGGVKG